MNFAFTEEQNELRRAARRFLATASSSEKVRRAMASESGVDAAVWSSMSQELGWLGLTIPERYEGLGLGPVDQLPLLEEMGRHLLCAPFFSTVCLGLNFLNEAATVVQKREYLPRIARGELTVTLALTEADGRWDANGISATAKPDGSDFLLRGRKRYVLDGHTADLLLVAARAEGSYGKRRDLGVRRAENRRKGSTEGPCRRWTRRENKQEIVLDSVRVPASACIGGEGSGWSPLRRALDLAAAGLAAEQVGGAEACLEMAVDYAKVRRQFGRAIGSFQAIKHICAGMLVKVEAARSAAYYAAAVAEAKTEELQVAASLAKSYCSDAFFHCAAENIQVHGGIGFTWEHDAHLFFKRAKSSESLLGDATHHREAARGLPGALSMDLRFSPRSRSVSTRGASVARGKPDRRVRGASRARRARRRSLRDRAASGLEQKDGERRVELHRLAERARRPGRELGRRSDFQRGIRAGARAGPHRAHR